MIDWTQVANYGLGAVLAALLIAYFTRTHTKQSDRYAELVRDQQGQQKDTLDRFERIADKGNESMRYMADTVSASMDKLSDSTDRLVSLSSAPKTRSKTNG